jgi:MFS family permease
MTNSNNHPFLSRERIIAKPGFNRWLVPPAALAIHLCIGMAYGFSVFWLPLSRLLGIDKPIACPVDQSFFDSITTLSCDWTVTQVTVTYSLFFVFLGSSAALFGGWLEKAGPRKAGVVSAFYWCGGLVISSLGIQLHQLWLLWLGSGVIGGIGLGLGYISPVSTLIKWFPDRRGMATGMAIMGFGGGAMIGSPLADILMRSFTTTSTVGVWQTFLVMAGLYFVFMMGGALGYRVPAENWVPVNWKPEVTNKQNKLISTHEVHLSVAWKTPQFWLIWWVLCLNVTAGIGVIAVASPMLQEVFAGKLIGTNAIFADLTSAEKKQIATIAAGFTGLISLFNIVGRFFWASLSDKLGRKVTYGTFFVLGACLYYSAPWAASIGSLPIFVGIFCIILSMYGGGFATVPAYLADMFGTKMVGAIHGRLLTAWSMAGIFGPMLVTGLRDYQLSHNVPKAQVYSTTLYILAATLCVGFICNLLVRPVASKYHMTKEQIDAQKTVSDSSKASEPSEASAVISDSESSGTVFLAWAAVGLPLAWGISKTIEKAILLFH